jgi:hypothetical protein
MSKYNQKYRNFLFFSYGAGLGEIFPRAYNNNRGYIGDNGVLANMLKSNR